MIVKETKKTHEKVRDFQNRLYLTAKTSKYNRKRQRNYKMGNAVKIAELTSNAGLLRMCG